MLPERLDVPTITLRSAGQRVLQCERGVSVVEFAFILPILLLLLVGAIDFGQVVLERSKLSAMLRAGAHYAAFSPDATEAAIATAANKGAGSTVAAATVRARKYCACTAEVSCSATCSGGSVPGRFVELTAQTAVPLLFDYPFVDSPVALTRSLRSGVP